MLENGDISEPAMVSSTVPYYTLSWLPSGGPFEFTTHPTKAPERSLYNKLLNVAGDIGILGLRYAGPGRRDGRARGIGSILK